MLHSCRKKKKNMSIKAGTTSRGLVYLLCSDLSHEFIKRRSTAGSLLKKKARYGVKIRHLDGSGSLTPQIVEASSQVTLADCRG